MADRVEPASVTAADIVPKHVGVTPLEGKSDALAHDSHSVYRVDKGLRTRLWEIPLHDAHYVRTIRRRHTASPPHALLAPHPGMRWPRPHRRHSSLQGRLAELGPGSGPPRSERASFRSSAMGLDRSKSGRKQDSRPVAPDLPETVGKGYSLMPRYHR